MPDQVIAPPADYCERMGDCRWCPNPDNNCLCPHHNPDHGDTHADGDRYVAITVYPDRGEVMDRMLVTDEIDGPGLLCRTKTHSQAEFIAQRLNNAGANLARQIDQLEELVNRDGATIYNIHHCNAGWGISFHEQRRQFASKKDTKDFREGLVTYGYHESVSAAVAAEIDRINLITQDKDEIRALNGVDDFSLGIEPEKEN